MPGNRKFTRIPPESTGDRIRVKSHTDVFYENRTGEIQRDKRVTLVSSGLTGRVSRVRDDSPTAGMISINFEDESEDADSISPITGEDIRINNVTVAQVSSEPPQDTYTNLTSLVSYDNNYYGQRVSEQGEAYVRFGDGPARVDASGKLEIGEVTILAQYSFTYDLSPDEFGAITSGNATITHSTPENCALLSSTANASDRALLRTHLYHHYTPGIPIIYEATTTHGDAGKENQIRRWGLFDDNDGLFFELDGTELSFVRRTNTSGSPVETKIPQSQWNRDTLLGSGSRLTNPSAVTLDITKINSFWIDYTWHGAGIVRFGVFLDGQRILASVESLANADPFSYMARGSLPMSWEIENTGTVTSGSEMRSWSGTVFAGSSFDIVAEGKTFTYFTGGPITINGGNETHLVSFRPRSVFGDVDNHNVASFIQINGMSYDTVTGDDGIVKIKAYVGGTFGGVGPNWQSVSNTSSLEKDSSGNYNNDGVQISEFYLKGSESWDLTNITGYWYRSMLKLADGTIPEYHFTAQRLFGTNDVAIDAQFRWKEVKG